MIFQNISLISQDVLPSSLNIFDKYRLNGAYGGLSNQKILSVGYRDQWNGLDGHPKQLYLSYNQPIYNLFGGGGIKVSSDFKGIKNVFHFEASYNYVFSGYLGLFSIGGALGSDIYSFSAEKIITPEGETLNNGIYEYNDGFLDGFVNNNSYFPSLSLFALYNYKNFEFGIVFDKKINVVQKEYNLGNIFKFNWQYNHRITPDIFVKAFGVIYTDFNVVQNEMSFVLNYKNLLGGFGLRGYSPKTFDSVYIVAGGNVNARIKVIYGFDISISEIKRANSGVHEIKLIYNFGVSNKSVNLPPVIYSPRL